MESDSATPAMAYDFHVHSDYSDGSDMATMVEAAREAGLDGVGFADHCNVSTEEPGVSRSFDLDETYPERRREIRALRDAFDVRIFDAVEMDYRPGDEDRIEAFLDEAGFEYAIGSVHHVGLRNVVVPGEFTDAPDAERTEFVGQYFELVVDLIESELFDVVAHVDITERNSALRDYATEEHYRDVAEALTASRTVPELNAGRVFAEYGEIHPHPEFLDVLQAADVQFVTGTDAHVREELGSRAEYLSGVVKDRDVDLASLQ